MVLFPRFTSMYGKAEARTMLVAPLVAFFKHKAVHSIIVLACWRSFEQIKFLRDISKFNMTATFTCDPLSFGNIHRYGRQGVLYFKQYDDSTLTKIKSEYFSGHYVWLVVDDTVPGALHRVRYDAEITLLRTHMSANESISILTNLSNEVIYLDDIHVHLNEGISSHPWAFWTKATGLVAEHDYERIVRRLNFEGYPMRIAAPVGAYSDEWYNGSYAQYIVDETLTELDAGIRCGYAASVLILEALNATEVLFTTELWSSMTQNSSMLMMLRYSKSELSGATLRILPERIGNVDFVMPIWSFHVGFTYLAERESSSNMYVEPFTAYVWWTCLAIGVVLAIAQRITARSQEEKDDAYCAVLATCLQQDASAVPKGISGRWTFMVLSVCAMLVHAYYTSAIVSALMSSGSGGPESLRALADSRYAIASEDYGYMRYLLFDVETGWDDLEYLKRKKKTSKFYQELERGVKLIEEGNTAFHSEYNQIYPHFKKFTDDQICKLKHVDTIPEVMSWLAATPNGQYTDMLRSAGFWLQEVGIAKRVAENFHALRPPCRAQLLAERVKFGDVAPLLGLTAFGAILSLTLLGVEILIARWRMGNQLRLDGDMNAINSEETYSEEYTE